jgi:hypothetical protein
MQSRKSAQNKVVEALGWTALGILVGVGVAFAAKQSQKEGKSPITKLEELFNVCEKDCEMLETQINRGQIAS